MARSFYSRSGLAASWPALAAPRCDPAASRSVGLAMLMLRVAAILVLLSPVLGAGIVPG
ncbi:hypothetical protein [Roseicella aquatilis]|uniref:hypothetical protein n=1 Tax=Roseicella aquatilis TaxID=2527868 RepID=UPI0014047002|nr:hypothetical protein [Roseicella aquatilis]